MTPYLNRTVRDGMREIELLLDAIDPWVRPRKGAAPKVARARAWMRAYLREHELADVASAEKRREVITRTNARRAA